MLAVGATFLLGQSVRVAICVGSLALGGAERAALALAESLVEANCQVSVALLSSSQIKSHYPVPFGVEKHAIGASRRWFLLGFIISIWNLRRLLRRLQPDCVVSFVTHTNIKVMIATRRLGIKTVLCERRNPESQPYGKITETLVDLVYPLSDTVVVQTDRAQEECSRRRLAEDIRVVPNIIPRKLAARGPSASMRRFCARKVIIVGRLVESKQPIHALDVFSEIRNTIPNASLHIFGTGALKPSLEVHATKLGLEASTTFHGADDHLWDEMEGASLMLFCSRFEGFPNALLEAAAVGLPAVAYDCISGPANILAPVVDACLVPLNRKFEMSMKARALLSDYDLWSDVSDKLHAHVHSRFSWDALSDKWQEILFEENIEGHFEPPDREKK